MDKIEKLFRKLVKKDRVALHFLIEELLSNKISLNIKKLQGGEFYRLRKSNFRIIFHYDSGGSVVVDSIKIRNEGTYKGLK